ncbi:OR8D4 protein, partial [Agelaius phoeniceus]|nr:OR8D4 protein [Agelaius phoeniceus]
NCTQTTEFSLAGFTEDPTTQVTLFLLFLLTYLVTILGNLGMITLIRASALLHSPMYYFLGNLAFVNLCTSTTITPRMLAGVFLGKKGITYAGCMAQIFTFGLFVVTECFLLAAMAYDRYVAICHPLLYLLVMSPERCSWLVTSSYLLGLTNGICALLVSSSCLAGATNAALHTGLALRLSFCGPKGIRHFYCEGPPLFALSCTDPAPNELGTFLMAGFSLAATVLAILLSYARILAAALGTHSAAGKRKAFSTCASQLAAVALFYGSLVSMYCRRSSRSSREPDKVASVFHTMVTPMLNPFIYSLRNQEVKAGLWRLMGRKHSAEK